jgi:hypothetical protein
MSRKKPKAVKNHPQAKPEHSGGEEKSTNRHVYIEPGAQIDFVKNLREKYDAAQRDDQTHKADQLFWTKVAAGLLLLATGFSGWQGFLTRKLINNSSKQFQKDQRPYVWPNGLISPDDIHIAENEVMWMNINLVNYGRSPALRESGIGKIFIGPNAMEDADRWFASFGNNPLPGGPDKERVIPPGIPTSSVTSSTLGGFSTIMSDHALTPKQADYIVRTDLAVAMVTRIEYYDSYGNRYWSDVCWSRFTNSSIPHCRKHNELH